jgi:hypothetical protein
VLIEGRVRASCDLPAVCQVEPGKQEILSIVVPMRGQVSERGTVEAAQRDAHGGRSREQRTAARIDLRYLGDLGGRVRETRSGDQEWRPYQRRPCPRHERWLPAAPRGQP